MILRLLTLLIISTCLPFSARAENFSLATLNVDGLPQKILMFNVNPEGPGSAGSVRISKYLTRKNYDMVFMQEDFNYHDELTSVLEDTYTFDTWSGSIGLEGYSIDFRYLQNLRFPCDGLGACWRSNITMQPGSGERTAWNDGFGKFSHDNDMMVTKGFRRYEATLTDGTGIVVYNMHMDSENELDTAEGKATPDRQARQAQWEQLRDYIMEHFDERPVIVLGDVNSFYLRDRVKEIFIDAIEATGKATVKDVWVELKNSGVYPTYEEGNTTLDHEVTTGETLDKILYINPTVGKQIKAVSFSCDKEGYMVNGAPLGDHFPIAATFEVTDSKSGIINVNGNGSENTNGTVWYNLQGQRVDKPTKGMFIVFDGKKARKITIE